MQRALPGIDLTKSEVRLPISVVNAFLAVRDEARIPSGRRTRPPDGRPPTALAPRARDKRRISWCSRPSQRWRAGRASVGPGPESPVRAIGRQHADRQHVPVDLDKFLFYLFRLRHLRFIYEFFLNERDEGRMDPVLSEFRPLTRSQRRIGKYFIVVALLLLAQIAAGTIMAHSYYDRTSFYGIAINDILPFNFLRDVHIQAPILWIGLS